MDLIKRAFRHLLKDPATWQVLKIMVPTVTLGTWLGYFGVLASGGTLTSPLWFYIAWPFIATALVLLLIFCITLIQLGKEK